MAGDLPCFPLSSECHFKNRNHFNWDLVLCTFFSYGVGVVWSRLPLGSGPCLAGRKEVNAFLKLCISSEKKSNIVYLQQPVQPCFWMIYLDFRSVRKTRRPKENQLRKLMTPEKWTRRRNFHTRQRLQKTMSSIICLTAWRTWEIWRGSKWYHIFFLKHIHLTF